LDGILGHNLLLSLAFFRWESLRGWDFLGHNLLLSRASFFTMELGLSRSLSHELFPFFTMFSRTFSFFTMGFWLSRSLFHELFLFFKMGSCLSRSLFHKLFLFFKMGSWISRCRGRLFLYIYHKEYLHRIRLVKNLAS
jgi:hypothetical protein